MAQVEDKPGVATRTLKNYIGGRWVEAEGAENARPRQPRQRRGARTGAALERRPGRRGRAGRARGLPRWRATPPLERARACFELKYLLDEAKDELALLVTTDNGKTIKDATGEVGRGIECVEVATGIPSLMQGTNLEDVSRGIDSDMIRQPIGVFAAVTPFNFPFMVPMWFLPFAIACGNTFVCKPSEQDPLAVERTFELLDQIGLPPGVVNLVHGGKDVRGRDPRAPRGRRRLLRRLDSGRPLHLRDRREARQARPGARRGEEPRHRHARRRPRHRGRRRALLGVPRGRAPGAASRTRSASPSATPTSRCAQRSPRRASRHGRRRGHEPRRRGRPGHLVRLAGAHPRLDRQGPRAGRRARPRRARAAAPRTATSSARRSSSPSPAPRSRARRSSAPC